MKRCLITTIMIFILPILILSNIIKNTTPENGNWDFQSREILKIEGYGEKLFARIHKVAIHEDGRIFMFDRTHFKFIVFDSNGKLLTTFGKRGEGPGEIKIMLNFYLLKDKIIVYDMGKIHHLSLDGKFLKSDPTSSTIGIAPDHFIDENRLIKSRLSLGRGPGQAKLEALELYDISTDKTIYLDGVAPEPSKGGPGGTMVMMSIGSDRLERNTAYVTSQTGNDLLWGKNNAYLIHLCNDQGKKMLSFSLEGRERTKISMASKERLVSKMRVQISGMSQEDLKKRLIKSIPDQATFFSQIVTDKNKLIYVYTSNVELNNGQEIDIFSPQGKYLYKSEVSIPKGQIIRANGVVFKGDFIYMVVEDEEGELSLRKYSCNLPKAI